MPYSYHPPTRTDCDICKKLGDKLHPIIDTSKGKASDADKFPIHNWYNFVLGYTPSFPEYILDKEKISEQFFVVDPFMGSGTTLVVCKMRGLKTAGVDANDYFEFIARTKINWNVDIKKLSKSRDNLFKLIDEEVAKYDWSQINRDNQLGLLTNNGDRDFKDYAKSHRPTMLVEKYISNAPFAKLYIIKDILENYKWIDKEIKNIFFVALAWSILPSSNVRYGPGFGVIKPRENIDVIKLYKQKIVQMVEDLSGLTLKAKETYSKTYLGDARLLSKYFTENSIDYMVTSPPYPGDHEYTKHSRLELILLDFAKSKEEFQVIKKRMLRGSTTNIYKEDKEGSLIKDITEIRKVADEIDKRLTADGGTSGFERLYSKLVYEYFGGMYSVFKEAYKVLRPGAKFALLVSDSHAFKMVHIETAKLLGLVAKKAGFVNINIELWQYKNSTSHKYKLLENILTVQKPSKS